MPRESDDAFTFETELTALAEEAAQTLSDHSRPKEVPSLARALRPLVIGIEAISRSQAEQGRLLAKLEQSSGASEEPGEQIQALKDTWERKNELMERLFSSLHGELKTYKDDFLFDLLHKPIIKDLITLFDDLIIVRGQMTVLSAESSEDAPPNEVLARLRHVEQNLHHGIHALEEVLARLQVERLPTLSGPLNKHLQRAVALETTANSDEDNTVVRSLRPGFMWRDRVVRAEEVVVRKFKSELSDSPQSPSPFPTIENPRL